MALSGALDLTAFASTPAGQLPEQTAILLDYLTPETKAGSRLALNTALEARNAGRKITVIMNKMLVHGAHGQQTYDQARKAGVKFLRYNAPEDIQIRKTDIGFSLTLKEITLPGTFVTLHCDQLVIPKVPVPGPGIDTAARLLRQEKDREGFLQSPNVRHRLTQSPRKGIYFAGPAHDDVDDTDLSAELEGIMADLDFPGPAQNAGVEINQKKCAQCLTCLRICPHQAIFLNEKTGLKSFQTPVSDVICAWSTVRPWPLNPPQAPRTGLRNRPKKPGGGSGLSTVGRTGGRLLDPA